MEQSSTVVELFGAVLGIKLTLIPDWVSTWSSKMSAEMTQSASFFLKFSYLIPSISNDTFLGILGFINSSFGFWVWDVPGVEFKSGSVVTDSNFSTFSFFSWSASSALLSNVIARGLTKKEIAIFPLSQLHFVKIDEFYMFELLFLSLFVLYFWSKQSSYLDIRNCKNEDKKKRNYILI